MDINQDISLSLQKIKTDWERSGQSGKGISRIDKDILIQDLRRLYDLVFELEISSANPGKVVGKSSPKVESYTREVVKPPTRQDQLLEGLPTQENNNDKVSNIHQDEKQPQKPEEVEPEIVEDEVPPISQKPKEAIEEIIEKPIDNQDTQTTKEPTKENQHNVPLEESVKKQATEKYPSKNKAAKSTSEKFHAPKTFADIYQKNGDNSLATKIKKNSISDVKAAIGINDKFLFISEIFKGNSQAYHRAIDTLNNYNHFHEALEFIENISVENKVENSEAAKDLIEIIKRKFQ